MIFSKNFLTVSTVIIAGLIAIFLFLYRPSTLPSTKSVNISSNPKHNLDEAPFPVKARPARIGDLIIKLKSPGEAVTERKIAIRTEVSGKLKSLLVEEGQHVEKDELLVELDDREYRLKLEKQEALRLKYLSDLYLERKFSEPEKIKDASVLERIEKAKEALNRATKLYKKQLISWKEFENAKKQYELTLIETGQKKEEIMASSKGLTQAEIDVKIAKMELEKTKIRAPFSGIITEIKVSSLENVEIGRDLFTLVDISQVKVEAKVLESEVGKMKVGQEVDLRFSAYPEKIFKGEVKAISPIINPQDRTCKVHIVVSNPEEALKPGMHAEVEIAAEVHKDRLLIPQDAVLVRGGRKLAFVVEDGLAKWRYIEVGHENEDYAEILDGVKEGELVIVEGHFTLAHDARIQVVE